MGRIEGDVQVDKSYEVKVARPMDARLVVPTKEDLFLYGLSAYNGMIVSVVNTGEVYVLLDRSKRASEAGWRLLGGTGGTGGVRIEVLDTLPEVGESQVLYFIKKSSTEVDAYDEYVYINQAWINLTSSNFNPNLYYTKDQVNELLASINTSIQDLSSRVNTLESNSTNYVTQDDISKMESMLAEIRKSYTWQDM